MMGDDGADGKKKSKCEDEENSDIVFLTPTLSHTFKKVHMDLLRRGRE